MRSGRAVLQHAGHAAEPLELPETMGGTTFSSVMMHTAMQSILSLANGRYKAQIIDPEMMAKVKAKGAFAIDQVMGRIIHYERDYMFRSQGNNPHEPMTTRCRFGGFGLSTNDYLKSYSDSTFYCRPNARGPGNYVPPPNTAAFRDLWYLNLGKGQVEFDKIAAVDLVDNALCFDLTLRREGRTTLDAVMRGGGRMQDAGHGIEWGPGRHGPG